MNTLKRKLKKLTSTLAAGVAAVSASVTSLSCADGIFASDGTNEVLKELATFYQQKLFLLVFGITLVIGLAFCKDEKQKRGWLMGTAGSVGAYIICYFITNGSLITDTVEWIAGTF